MGSTLDIVDRFNIAFGNHDVDALMAQMTEDCVFESTSPPDGERRVGQSAVRKLWEQFFASSPQAKFTAEDVIESGDRCVVQWRYEWIGDQGKAGHIRGVDLFRVRDGKVAEKLSYVKG